jgi:hypothetical protein
MCEVRFHPSEGAYSDKFIAVSEEGTLKVVGEWNEFPQPRDSQGYSCHMYKSLTIVRSGLWASFRPDSGLELVKT